MLAKGLKTESVIIRVTREEIRRYCEVIGETNNIFFKLESAKNAGFTDLVLPVTYPMLFWKYIDVPWLKSQISIIQGEQSFEYNEALVANKDYVCQITLVKVRQRGRKKFLQHELCISHNGKLIATSNTTLVLED